MPRILSVFIRGQIRLLKPIYNKFSIETARAFQDTLGNLEAKSVASKVVFEPVDFERFKACVVCPKENVGQKNRVILYLHGGGYVAGNIEYARGFAGVLAVQTNRHVLSAAYRLAPEHPFPAAVDDALEAYEFLLKNGYEAKDISLVGESAGGGLIFSLCQVLKQKELPLPAALVGISPWTDLTFSGQSYKTNKKKDPTLSEKALRTYAAHYAPQQETNPLVSPVYGDLCGFPPSLLFAGENELLLSDATMLADSLKRCGSQCELIVEKGLWHVYVLFKIAEAREALKRIAVFLET